MSFTNFIKRPLFVLLFGDIVQVQFGAFPQISGLAKAGQGQVLRLVAQVFPFSCAAAPRRFAKR